MTDSVEIVGETMIAEPLTDSSFPTNLPAEGPSSPDASSPVKRPLDDPSSLPPSKRVKDNFPTLKKSENHGICEFISRNHNGFFGILKHRISDFIVNEIDAEGRVVKLTSFDVADDEDEDADAPLDFAEASGRLKSLVGDEAFEKVKTLAEATRRKRGEEEGGKTEKEKVDEESPARQVLLPAPSSRDARAALHSAIRAAFPSLESQTDDVIEGEDFAKVLRVKPLVDCLMTNTQSRKSRGFLHPGKRLVKWPKNRPQFCHFVLYKENQDTMDALNALSGNLGLKTGNFVFSGTKDKRGITSQRVSMQKVDARRLLGLNKKLKLIKVGNFEYRKTGLRLGDNWGNQFRIVLRGMKEEEKGAAATALKDLAEMGFINYYGMQRFGSTEVSTHSIGVALLRRDWRAAVELILRPRPNDRHDLEACRRVWSETRDPQRALDKLLRRKCPERCLLSGLVKHAPKNDFCGALAWIPRPTRLMYVHAYQSLIWNVAASTKMARHGLAPRVGDLVAPRRVGFDDGDRKIETKDVKVLTESDVGDHDIYDVVLPLVGHDVVFPDNESKTWMEEVFTKDGLTLQSFKSSVRDYALPGGYRRLVVRPEGLEWRFLRHEEEEEALNEEDEEEIVSSHFMRKKEKGKDEDEEKVKEEKEESIDEEEGETKDDSIAKCKDEPANVSTRNSRLALAMKFSLPSSCYATMAIREILRMDVSAGFQATLNADGFQATLNADGFQATLNADGDEATLNADGDRATLNADGDEATLNADGDRATLNADGFQATLNADGDRATLNADGDRATLNADGDEATLNADGDRATLNADGDRATFNAVV